MWYIYSSLLQPLQKDNPVCEASLPKYGSNCGCKISKIICLTITANRTYSQLNANKNNMSFSCQLLNRSYYAIFLLCFGDTTFREQAIPCLQAVRQASNGKSLSNPTHLQFIFYFDFIDISIHMYIDIIPIKPTKKSYFVDMLKAVFNIIFNKHDIKIL